jgi:hypothetical protein
MKASTATISVTAVLLTYAASAQDGPTAPARRTATGQYLPGTPAAASQTSAPTPGTSAAPAPARVISRMAPRTASGSAGKVDQRVFPAGTSLPGPTPLDQLKPATIALPNDPIEPWLLTKDVGPFLVLAKTFRGPEAERYALALAMELRRDHGLPAHILRTKDFPMGSNIRNVPPTAPAYLKKSQLTHPEKTRTYDEAAVLVGDEKTLDDSEALLKKVKWIRPKCLNEVPGIFGHREGLSAARRTTNPYVPTQNIYPGRKKDRLITQMNSGPRSIFHCPGRYTIQVAAFSGRTVLNPGDKDVRFFEKSWLSNSPLRTAADDAEKLAEALAKDKEVQKTGFQPYVYHDRTSSKVMIGAFTDPKDPNAVRLRETLIKIAVPLADRNHGLVMAPAPGLTDLEDPNRPIKLQ